MANPGKTYSKPCTYKWYFGSHGSTAYISDYVKFEGKEYSFGATVIDKGFTLSFLTRDIYDHEEDCACCGQK